MQLFSLLVTIGTIFGFREVFITPKYGSFDKWKTCEIDTDCIEGFVCVQAMWRTKNWLEHDSGRGCFSKSVCSGNGAWDNFRDLEEFGYDSEEWQFFCNQFQARDAHLIEMPYPFTQAPTHYATEF